MKRPESVAIPAILASLALLCLLAVFVYWPPLVDITTTPADPPQFRTGPAAGVPYPSRYAGLQRRAYPDLVPHRLSYPVPAAFVRAESAARGMKHWRIVLRDDSQAVLQAEDRTPLFGFRNDIVIEVRPAGAGSEVHVRSRSRMGRADFGANARRVRAYLAEIE